MPSMEKDNHELMETKNIRHLLVMSGDGLVGVVSDRDVLAVSLRSPEHKILAPETEVSEIMTRNPITVHRSASIARVAETLLDEKIDCLPILDNKRVYGIVTSSDLLELLTDNSYERAEEPLPLTYRVLDFRSFRSPDTIANAISQAEREAMAYVS